MPTYEYRCRDCGHEFEIQQSMSDDPLTECPSCGGDLRKVFSPVGIAFKGSGFYKNDSGSRSKSSTGGEWGVDPATGLPVQFSERTGAPGGGIPAAAAPAGLQAPRAGEFARMDVAELARTLQEKALGGDRDPTEVMLKVYREAELTDQETGRSYTITPGTMYLLDGHERHTLRVKEDFRCVCVFNPPVTGREDHDENGVYPLLTEPEEV